MISAWLFVLAQGGSWSGGRPPECGAVAAAGVNVWERAKSPELWRYCDLLASAASKLAAGGSAPAALEAAREADRIAPGHAAARTLEARALARLGRFDAAAASFAAARATDPHALDDPPALLDWARLLARLRRDPEAAAAYRSLLPRASALPSPDRSAAAIEAGVVLMSHGPSGLDDATAALREAVRSAQDEAATLAVLSLALALDRGGDASQAQALVAGRAPGDPRSALASPEGRELAAVAPVESEALLAIGLEPIDAPASRRAWDAYLADAPGGPWVAHARTHRAALGGRAVPQGRR